MGRLVNVCMSYVLLCMCLYINVYVPLSTVIITSEFWIGHEHAAATATDLGDCESYLRAGRATSAAVFEISFG